MSEFQSFKLQMLDLLGLSKDALHIYAGLAVFLVAAMLIRRPGRAWWALLAVALVAVGAELLDLRDDLRSGEMQWSASAHDILNTMFWPAVVATLAHTGRIRFPSRKT